MLKTFELQGDVGGAVESAHSQSHHRRHAGMAGYALYAVACSSPDEAVQAVRAVLPANWRVKGAIGPISSEAIALLQVGPGEAKRL